MQIPRKMVEAGARALLNHNVLRKWDQLNEEWRDEYRKAAEAAIRAAIGCAEVLVTNDEPKGTMTYLHGDDEDDLCFVSLRPGDTILIVRAEKGGGQ